MNEHSESEKKFAEQTKTFLIVDGEIDFLYLCFIEFR